MTAFVVAPLHFAKSFNGHDARTATQLGQQQWQRQRQRRCQVTSRMRNPGGFSLPPRQPVEEVELRRAVELLGNFTQRRMTNAAKLRELEDLVGAVPPSRWKAQQWKHRLEQILKPRGLKPKPRIIAELPLPRNQKDVDRLFILLEVVRKRHSIGVPISDTLKHKISKRLNGNPCPTSSSEARLYIRTLVYFQRLRKVAERRPPVIPAQDLERLRLANQLLGAYIGNGSIGKQIHVLFDIIRSYPPSKNAAASWKKLIEAAIRRKIRKDRVHAKRLIDDEKREQRRLKRLRRLQEAEGTLLNHESNNSVTTTTTMPVVEMGLLPSQCDAQVQSES